MAYPGFWNIVLNLGYLEFKFVSYFLFHNSDFVSRGE
jgi:hypothetical protein